MTPQNDRNAVVTWSSRAVYLLKNFGLVRAPYSVAESCACTTWQTRVFYDILPLRDTYMFVRGPRGARAVPVLGLTSITQNPYGLSGRLNQRIRYTGPVLAPCGVSKSVRTPCGPRAVVEGLETPHRARCSSILSLTPFPAYSIMSLSQCKIYWLDGIMPCAVKRVNDNMPSAHDALRGPWPSDPMNLMFIHDPSSPNRSVGPYACPYGAYIRSRYGPRAGPARAAASHEHLRVSYRQNIVESPCLKVVQTEFSAIGYTAPVRVQNSSKIVRARTACRTGPHGSARVSLILARTGPVNWPGASCD